MEYFIFTKPVAFGLINYSRDINTFYAIIEKHGSAFQYYFWGTLPHYDKSIINQIV